MLAINTETGTHEWREIDKAITKVEKPEVITKVEGELVADDYGSIAWANRTWDKAEKALQEANDCRDQIANWLFEFMKQEKISLQEAVKRKAAEGFKAASRTVNDWMNALPEYQEYRKEKKDNPSKAAEIKRKQREKKKAIAEVDTSDTHQCPPDESPVNMGGTIDEDLEKLLLAQVADKEKGSVEWFNHLYAIYTSCEELSEEARKKTSPQVEEKPVKLPHEIREILDDLEFATCVDVYNWVDDDRDVYQVYEIDDAYVVLIDKYDRPVFFLYKEAPNKALAFCLTDWAMSVAAEFSETEEIYLRFKCLHIDRESNIFDDFVKQLEERANEEQEGEDEE